MEDLIMKKVCKSAGDDLAHQKRPATQPGPRCATCWREVKRERKAKARAMHVARTYGLSQDDVDAIKATMPTNAAGIPVCPGCLYATGASKALAIDHDHVLERRGLPARETVRGILCGPDNQVIGLGLARLKRLVAYLENPPAPEALGLAPRPFTG
jgi:hypothetical protein